MNDPTDRIYGARCLARRAYGDALRHVRARFVYCIAAFIVLLWAGYAYAGTIRQEASGKVYVSEEFGFRLACPKGWFIHNQPPIPGAFVSMNMLQTPEYMFPGISVSVDNQKENESAMDFAKEVIKQHRDRMKSTVLEEPHEIKVGSVDGVRFAEETVSQKGRAFRLIQCVFPKERQMISVMWTDLTDQFDAHRQSFEDTLTSFSFLDPNDDFMSLTKLSRKDILMKAVDPQSYATTKQAVLAAMSAKRSFKSMLIVKDRGDPLTRDAGAITIQWVMAFNSPKNFEIEQIDYIKNVADIWRVAGDYVYSKIAVWMPMPDGKDVEGPAGAMLNARKEIYKTLSSQKYLALLEGPCEPLEIGHDNKNNCTILKLKPEKTWDMFSGEARQRDLSSEVYLWISDADNTIRFAQTYVTGVGLDKEPIDASYEHYLGNYDAIFVLGTPDMSWRSDVFSHPETGFLIQAPPEWKKEEFMYTGAQGITWSKAGNKDIPYIVISVYELNQEISLEEFADRTLEHFKDEKGIAIVEKPHAVDLNGTQWMRIVSDSNVPDKDGKPFVLRTATYMFIAPPYSIQIFVADSKDHFNQIEGDADKALQSITFQKNE